MVLVAMKMSDAGEAGPRARISGGYSSRRPGTMAANGR